MEYWVWVSSESALSATEGSVGSVQWEIVEGS